MNASFSLKKIVGFLCVFMIFMTSQKVEAVTRTWFYMTTGNGHGFQIFDRKQNRITYFLEHPYRYVAPGDATRTWGVSRRNLAHDIYFGVNLNGKSVWLHNQTIVSYEKFTNIIHAQSTENGFKIDTYYFAPYGYNGNGMVMLIRVKNSGSSEADITVFAKPNLKFGMGRPDPGEENEEIKFFEKNGVSYMTETGPGGGHAIYIPIGGFTGATCGKDSLMYNDVLTNGDINDTKNCNDSGIVPVFKNSFTLKGGEEKWWGLAVLFVNDNPNDPQAELFKDKRSVDDIVSMWKDFLNNRSPKQVHDDALKEWDEWRTNVMPADLSETEKKLWLQSEAVLRMGQVLEPVSSNRKNHGMFLASLPVGEWHTGWVRDGVYAIVAMAMLGHFKEAKNGIMFFLGAESGFFKDQNYLKEPYRVSVCRYFGNGMEEGDFNNDGPNIETDGWGLVLWGARMVLEYSCDFSWLSEKTLKGDTVYEGLKNIAEDISKHIKGNLPEPDASIWEVHWNRRQVFTYTVACQTRGLFDFAQIAKKYGDMEAYNKYKTLAENMLKTAKEALVYAPTNGLVSHLNVAGSPVHVDGSTVEMFSWQLIDTTDPIFTGTMNEYSKLLTKFGGYRRLEPNLSLTGQASANEYDLSEWILLDLRIGDQWRRSGNPLGDKILDKITEQASANDFLIPELFDPNNGKYNGVVPMVGYGAGAWIMSQFHKHGLHEPGPLDGFSNCENKPKPDAGVVENEKDVTVYDTNPKTDNKTYLDAPYSKDATYNNSDVSGLNDGKALLCSYSESAGNFPEIEFFMILMVLFMLMFVLKRKKRQKTITIPIKRVFLILSLLFYSKNLVSQQINTTNKDFAKEKQEQKWELLFHGYARMPLRWHGSPKSPRPPYLVDDNYYLSGFQYTRVQETDWAEIFITAKKGNTSFTAGFFSSQFSDWSEPTLQGQWGIATAFIKHRFFIKKSFNIGVKAGMFWEPMGHIRPYDTYIFGRTHQAGIVLDSNFKLYGIDFFTKFGYGAHADLINANQGFTPLMFFVFGAKYKFLKASLYYLSAWTRDSERQFAIVENGDLDVFGADVSVDIPKTGPLYFAIAHYKASNVLFLANAFELLHSTGGRGLTENFFGPDSENGTGEILVTALYYPIHIFKSFKVELFEMSAWVLSKQQSEDPLKNKHDRVYFKWGIKPIYFLPHPFNMFFLSLRYDRVILDLNHDSMSFRLLTPVFGIAPIKNLQIFFAYSHYWYGENIKLRPNQIPGDLSVTKPDEDVFKIQAQITW